MPIHPLEIAGVGFTIAFLAIAWIYRDRLNAFGLEFVAWRKTSLRESVEAAVFGAVCGLATALIFQPWYRSTPFHWQDAWMGVTLGPLTEEAVFRGYLFGIATWGLRKVAIQANWIAGLAIAAVFALCHLAKAGITLAQISLIFAMGLVYAWLRIKTKSTTAPFVAHAGYNAVIFSAAWLLG